MNRSLAFTLFSSLALVGIPGPVWADEPASTEPPRPEDLLGNIVVVAGATRPLPRIAVLPSSSFDEEDVLLRNVARRDLDLSGEFDLLSDDEVPDTYSSADSLELAPWSRKKVEALVEVRAAPLDGGDKVALRGRVFLVHHGATAVFDKRFVVSKAAFRVEAHRLSDLIIGALTGTNGSFASHMAFVSNVSSLRQVFTLDADGHDVRPVSASDEIALSPAFGKNDELYFTTSRNKGEYKIRNAAGTILDLPIKGSVYGLAFSKDRSRVAVSIGVGTTIKLFAGPDFTKLDPVSEIGMALRPSFSPSGKIGFSGEGHWGQRIYVDGKPVSPDGLFASSPTFCNHPDGIRVVYAVGVGKDTDLVSTDERGGGMIRLTQSQGRNGYPACSPDGRLVAFFSTRTSGEGPGLYVMRLDGGRAKRISTFLGDSLRWEPLPTGQAVEVKN